MADSRNFIQLLRSLGHRRINPRDFDGLLVGAFLGVMLLTLTAVSISAMVYHGFLGQEEYRLYCYFEKGWGLREGTGIQINGVPVGRVTGLELKNDGRVRLEMTIQQEYQPLISEKSEVFAARPQNLISERVIMITTANTSDRGKVLGEGDEMIAGDAQDIETILANVIDLIDRIETIAYNTDSLIQMALDTNSTVGALLGSSQLYDELNHTILTVNGLLREGSSLVNLASKRVPGILDQVDTITGQVVTIAGDAQLIINSLDTTVYRVNTLLNDAQELLGSAGNLMIDGEQMMVEVDDLVSSVNQFWFISNDIPRRDTIINFIGEEW